MGVPCVIKTKKGYLLLLEGRKDNVINRWRIFGAKSKDFVDWIPLNDGFPIFKEKGVGWECVGVANPHLIRFDNGYLLMYSGMGSDGKWRIGMATSNNLRWWKRYRSNPVLVHSLDWDCNDIESSFLVADRLYWRLYYNGWSKDYVCRIGLAICRQIAMNPRGSFLSKLFSKFVHRKNYSGTIVNRESLVSSLKRLGLDSGDGVLVHCSLSSFGFVVGGAETVIEALKDCVGENGVVLMPCFTCPTDNVFDVDEPCDRSMGCVAETFRKLGGSVRSLHPTHSVVANGKGAKVFVYDHHNCEVPFGEGSPFSQLLKFDGKILLLGVDQTVNSMVHLFECGVDGFPFDVYLPNLFQFTVKDRDREVRTVEARLFNPEVSKLRDINKITPYLLDRKMLKQTVIGKATCRLMKAKDLMAILDVMLKKGETIYTLL